MACALEQVRFDSSFEDVSPIVQDHLHAVTLNGRVRDFSPLRACPLDTLVVGGDFTDVSMFANPRLKNVGIQSTLPVRLGALGDLYLLDLNNSVIADPEDLPLIRTRTLMLEYYKKMPDLRMLDASHLDEVQIAHTDGFKGQMLPQGMKLRHFDISWSGPADLAFLADQPLQDLSFVGIDPLTWQSLAALRQVPLVHIESAGAVFSAQRFWSQYDPAHMADPHSPASIAEAVTTTPKPALPVRKVGHEHGLLCEMVPGISTSVEDMNGLPASKTCVQAAVDLSVLGTAENTGLRFKGFITVPKGDVYSFALSSDDGSRLIIDGTVVVDNDGLHAETTRTGAVNLAAGAHTVMLLYFQAAGGSALLLETSSPGGSAAAVPDAWWSH